MKYRTILTKEKHRKVAIELAKINRLKIINIGNDITPKRYLIRVNRLFIRDVFSDVNRKYYKLVPPYKFLEILAQYEKRLRRNMEI